MGIGLTPSIEDSRLWHLKKCPLFSALSDEELHSIWDAFDLVDLPRNTIVPPPAVGEPSLYIIKLGYVRLNYTDAKGNEATVLLLGPGDVFGSLYGDEDEAFGEHCRTLKPCCLARITRRRFERQVGDRPKIAYEHNRQSFLRAKRLQVRLAEMMMLPAEPRLAKALLELDRQIGKPEPAGARKLMLPLSHRELAQLIGTSREFVTKLLGGFRDRGLVDTSGRRIVLTDPAALEKLASQE